MTLVRTPAPFSTSSLVLSSSFTPATSAPNAGMATHKDNIKTALIPILDTRSPEGSARAARRVALHVHRHRVHRDVGGGGFDVHRERGGIATEPLRTDAEHVDGLAELRLELRALRIVTARAQRPRRRHLGKMHAQIRRAADADADDGRRAGLAAGLDHAIDDESLDRVHTLGGNRHAQPGGLFGPPA